MKFMIPYRQSSPEKIFILVIFGHIVTFYVFCGHCHLSDKTSEKAVSLMKQLLDKCLVQVLTMHEYAPNLTADDSN